MRTVSKIGLTFIILMVGAVIIALLNAAQGAQRGNGGPIGGIFSLGMVAAIIAIWRWKPESEKKKDGPNNNQQLDKS